MSTRALLIIVLVILLFVALPTWPYMHTYGNRPVSFLAGLILGLLLPGI